jgi:hypothetical protein
MGGISIARIVLHLHVPCHHAIDGLAGEKKHDAFAPPPFTTQSVSGVLRT